MKVNLIRRNETTTSLCGTCDIRDECQVHAKFGAAFDVDSCEHIGQQKRTEEVEQNE